MGCDQNTLILQTRGQSQSAQGGVSGVKVSGVRVGVRGSRYGHQILKNIMTMPVISIRPINCLRELGKSFILLI